MNPRPRNPFDRGGTGAAECPVDTALSVVSGRWKGSILWRIAQDGPQRPGALRRQILGASEAVILRQLTELVRDGILTRIEEGGYPLHVTYAFTPYGETLGPIVEQLCAWGRQHQGVMAAAASPSGRT